jgi:hypothetical protein
MKKLLLLIAALILLGVLLVVYIPFTPTAPAQTQGAQDTTALGADRDAHGCIASAGYTYSVVRQACIRVWEDAIALAPTVTLGDPALPAYVIRSSDWQHAEIFLPEQEDSVVLTLQTTPNDPAWEDPYGNWKLTYDKIQGWKLAQDGEVIYTAGPEKI